MIDIAQVQGQVHAQSVQKVGELADKTRTKPSPSSANGCTSSAPRDLTWPSPQTTQQPTTSRSVVADAGEPAGQTVRKAHASSPARSAPRC